MFPLLSFYCPSVNWNVFGAVSGFVIWCNTNLSGNHFTKNRKFLIWFLIFKWYSIINVSVIRKCHNLRPKNKPWHRIERYISITATWQQEHKLSKATSSLFLNEMIAKSQRGNAALPYKTSTKHKTPPNNGSSNEQCISNIRTIALDWTDAEATRRLKYISLVESASPKIMLLLKQKIEFSSHGGFQTY